MGAGDAAEWLLHAESDLTYAKLGQAEPAILRNQVTFHAQQAAEKAFKAALVHAAVEFPKTHDLQTPFWAALAQLNEPLALPWSLGFYKRPLLAA